MAAHNELGKKGEDLVAGFLEAKGYHIMDRNYRFQKGEVDMVALSLDPAELVFIEVKTRSNTQHEYPEESVSPQKQKMIFKVADSYVYEKQLFTVPVRFDIVAVSMDDPQNPLIHHIEDAFQMTNLE